MRVAVAAGLVVALLPYPAEAADEITPAEAVRLLTAGRTDRLNPRRHIFLDGDWEFRPERERVWVKACVPGNWHNLPGMRGYTGTAEYRKTIAIPPTWNGDPWLVFGAVDYAARVVVNDRYVGFHEGGYTPFAFNIGHIVRPGQMATISLVVEDPGPGADIRGYPFEEIPHGKQSWYGNVSGPWQPVILEERARTHVRSLKITPDIRTSSVRLEVTLSQTPPAGRGQLLATVYAPRSAAPVARLQADLTSALTYSLTARIPGVELWSPESPSLYTVNISIVTEDGAVVDQFADRFGMRSITAKDGRILLNGKPIFLSGALDQDFYPETDYTPPSEEFLRDQFLKAKKLGLNLLRCHIKIPDPLYLRLADEIGLLVWYELPNVGTLTPAARARLTTLMKEAAVRDYNRPSLIIVSLFNESWGIDMSRPEQRKWLVSAFDTAKSLFGDRLIVDNSACAGNFHIKTDMEDFHGYFALPDSAGRLADWLDDFAGRPAWTFSPHGDALRRGDEPLVVSEIGSWALPSLQSLFACHGGQKPWWFSTATGALRPEGVEDRFRQTALDRVFGDFGRLARNTQEMQLLSFKHTVEEIRLRPAISGFVWTELTDLQWESNGLMDFCRNLKSVARIAPLLTGPRCVIIRPQRRNVRPGEAVTIRLSVSNFGEALDSSTFEWALEGFPDVTGTLQAPTPAPAASGGEGGEFSFLAPEVSSHRVARLTVRWVSGSRLLAQNYEDINILPDAGALRLQVYVDSSVAGSEELDEWLRARGATVVSAPLTADVAITGKLTEDLIRWTAEGGRTLLLARDISAFGEHASPVRLASRSEADMWGDWASVFTWFDRSPVFAGLNTRHQMLDWTFAAVIPDHIVTGLPDAAWDDVECGMFAGWLHKGSAVVLRAGTENARVLITTLRLTDALGDDPVADQLLHNLLRRVSGPSFPVGARWDALFGH
ncbi:MAG: hypothetical protein KatS3mg024_0818 [Armatimonadota bacterium]|nr:MAG: hypothetical protein KatS3mg024_0818 [Armatimonadota bacterium]